MIEYDMYSRTYAEFAEQRVAKIENSQKGEQRTKGNVTLGDFFYRNVYNYFSSRLDWQDSQML